MEDKKIPHRITVKLNKSLNEKATYYKLFKRMNYEQKATSFIQLLGAAFLGNVGHFEIPAKRKLVANPRSSLTSATTQARSPSARPHRCDGRGNRGRGGRKPVPVAAPISDQRCFIWEGKPRWYDKMWPSIFVDNDEEGRRLLPELIKSALNFEGLAYQAYLKAKALTLASPAAGDNKAGNGNAKPADSDDDILNGVGD